MRDSTPVCSATGEQGNVTVTVLDTGALIAGLQLRLPMPSFTTQHVMNEVKDRQSRELLKRSLEAGKLIVLDPGSVFLRLAADAARSAGTLERLSEADISVIALALAFASCGKKVVVATDDYSVQMTSLSAGLEVLPVRYRGVREARRRPPANQNT
ncbi:MAG: hypothetical protein ACP5HK_02640 [Acidilobus sp.]